MSSEFITYELADNVALIGLNRPDKRNAINDVVVEQLRAAVVRANDEADAAVIFGHGKNFSAGLDLAELAGRLASDAPRPRKRKANPWHTAFDLIARGSIPFVAALHGATIGGGLELAAAAQIRVADETTVFALPEGQRGIFVGGGGAVRIQRIIGYLPRLTVDSYSRTVCPFSVSILLTSSAYCLVVSETSFIPIRSSNFPKSLGNARIDSMQRIANGVLSPYNKTQMVIKVGWAGRLVTMDCSLILSTSCRS